MCAYGPPDCRHTWSIFHELRTYPKGRSFLFDDVDYDGCKELPSRVPAFSATLCDAFREALRSGDVKKCDSVGDGAGICRAYMAVDASLCDQAGIGSLKGVVEGECKKLIERRGFLAQGLPEVAKSGQPPWRELAAAALGRADACQGFAKPAMDICLRSSEAPAAEAPAAEAPAEGAAPAAGEGDDGGGEGAGAAQG
jgi:hypothetical protein